MNAKNSKAYLGLIILTLILVFVGYGWRIGLWAVALSIFVALAMLFAMIDEDERLTCRIAELERELNKADDELDEQDARIVDLGGAGPCGDLLHGLGATVLVCKLRASHIGMHEDISGASWRHPNG